MQKIYSLLGIALLFLFQSPVVSSLDCKQVSLANEDICKELLNSDLSFEEKEMIILNLDYQSSFFPDHDYILDRNTDLEIEEIPEGVDIVNDDFVKNAWVKIFSLMPSIQYNGELHSPKETSVLTGFNYEIDIPSNYYSSDYPRTSKGDCKRKYYLDEENAVNRVYLNNRYIDKGELVDILLARDSEIKVIYDIYIKVKIKHYEWDRDCLWRNLEGKCVKYDYDCKYDYTEYKTDRVSITDTLNVKLYENDLFAEVKPINFYNEITNLKLNFSDSIEVDFKNSYYNFNKYVYSVNYSYPPYYVLTLVAEDYNKEKISNLFSGDNLIALKDFTKCKIKAFDFFNIIESDCENKFDDINISIQTDKFKYKSGEKINIRVLPDDIEIKLTYNNKSKVASGRTSFVAVLYENLITAEYGGIHSEKIIYVVDNDKLAFIVKLAIFALLNYLIYKLLKEYYRRAK